VVAVGAALALQVGDQCPASSLPTDRRSPACRALASARRRHGRHALQFVAGDENGFVKIPDYLSFEGSHAACAGDGLSRCSSRGAEEGRVLVLLQGTGGVSTFGRAAAAERARPSSRARANNKIAN
jgi:hypothetical protein